MGSPCRVRPRLQDGRRLARDEDESERKENGGERESFHLVVELLESRMRQHVRRLAEERVVELVEVLEGARDLQEGVNLDLREARRVVGVRPLGISFDTRPQGGFRVRPPALLVLSATVPAEGVGVGVTSAAPRTPPPIPPRMPRNSPRGSSSRRAAACQSGSEEPSGDTAREDADAAGDDC